MTRRALVLLAAGVVVGLLAWGGLALHVTGAPRAGLAVAVDSVGLADLVDARLRLAGVLMDDLTGRLDWLDWCARFARPHPCYPAGRGDADW